MSKLKAKRSSNLPYEMEEEQGEKEEEEIKNDEIEAKDEVEVNK